MGKKDVLTFRVETICTFGGTLYKATDDCKKDEVGLHQFPASMLYDVPQHFTAVEVGYLPPDEDGYRALIEMGLDDETNEARKAYFGSVLPVLQDPSVGEPQRREKAEKIKANFVEFGQAENPAGATEVVPEVNAEAEALRLKVAELEAALAAKDAPKAPADMTKAELTEALKALGFDAPPALNKAELIDKLAELTKAQEA